MPFRGRHRATPERHGASNVLLVPSDTEQSEVRNPAKAISYISLLTILTLWGTVIAVPLIWFWMGLYQEDITEEPIEATTVDLWTSVFFGPTTAGPAPSLPDDSGRLPQDTDHAYSTISRTQTQRTSTARTLPTIPTKTYPIRHFTFSTAIRTARRRKRRSTPTTTTKTPATTSVPTLSARARSVSTARSTVISKRTTNKFNDLLTYTGDFDVDDPDFDVAGKNAVTTPNRPSQT